MRDFKFTEQERPTMANFNARFDAIAALANGLGNEYIWAKERWNWEVVKSDSTKNWTLVQDNNTNRTYVRYSDDIILDNDGNISLAEPITQIYPTYESAGSLQLDNKYVQLGRVSYAEAETKPVWFSDGVTFNGINTYNLAYRTLETLHRRTLFGYVNSPDPNAYPPSVSDGYTYTALGQLGNKVRIETGSYTGTGTYGSSNPNSLTFDFEPKFLLIFEIIKAGTSSNGYIAIMTFGSPCYWLSAGGLAGSNNVFWTKNTVSWFNNADSTNGLSADYCIKYQLNKINVTYNYIAIG